MRYLAAGCLAATIIMACRDSTGPRVSCRTSSPSAPLDRSTTANFSARVTKIIDESGNISPGGPMTQCDLWVAIAPSSAANAGVIITVQTPVFVQVGVGAPAVAKAGDVIVGDAIEVWRKSAYAIGAVESPPSAPAYTATQVIIHR
jgi:hypothetical protein